MKSTLFLILFLSNLSGLFSQGSTSDNAIQTALKVKALQEKKAEYHKHTNGESEGYRVKIHFSADKSKAEEARVKFESKYSDVSSYLDYQQPNWVIIVGDYKTKLEAYELLKKIKDNFPYGFIVKSKVRPMKL